MEPNPLSDRLISTSFDMVDQRAQKSGLRRGAPAPKARQRFKITRRPGSLLRWKAAPWSKQQSDADNAQLTWICEERWRRDVFSSARRERRPWRGPLRTKGKAEGSCCGPQGITYIHCPFRDRRPPKACPLAWRCLACPLEDSRARASENDVNRGSWLNHIFIERRPQKTSAWAGRWKAASLIAGKAHIFAVGGARSQSRRSCRYALQWNIADKTRRVRRLVDGNRPDFEHERWNFSISAFPAGSHWILSNTPFLRGCWLIDLTVGSFNNRDRTCTCSTFT